MGDGAQAAVAQHGCTACVAADVLLGCLESVGHEAVVADRADGMLGGEAFLRVDRRVDRSVDCHWRHMAVERTAGSVVLERLLHGHGLVG